MTDLYLRKFSLIFADAPGQGLDLRDFHVQFTIRQNESQTPNSADTRLYNPAPATVNRIVNEFPQVVVQAGYEGQFGTIFSGTLVQRRSGRT